MDIKIDQITRTKRKTLAIIIQVDGKVVVRAPKFASDRQIHQFVQSKKKWIFSKKEQIQSKHVPEHRFSQGERFLFLGEEYSLDLVNPNKHPLILDGRFLLNKEKQTEADKLFTNWYREISREIFTERVLFFSKQYSLKFSKIRISSARTRWGSCSSSGTLSFTWRLVMAPLEIIDYVIIHELIHTKIKNHSTDFWKKVAELEPNYKMKRKWLRNNGHLLSI